MRGKTMKAAGTFAAAALLLAAALCLAALPKSAFAEETGGQGETAAAAIEKKHITTANEFLSLVALSRERDTSNWVVYLDNDIELGDDDMQTIVQHTVKHLSFGNSEHPFAGVFDGQNHTVTGLKYPNNVGDPERDTGFFAETKGATIKNFLVKDADVWADFRGGIIVGKAVDTHIENVMVMESTLHVTCANNALNLITNAGFEGGIIAGELDGCTVYNCEVRGGRAVNNTTSGVQALGGEGLYMAAFAGYVGKSDSGKVTTIEYSRVTPTRNEDGTASAYTNVTNKYDVAVGALGGNNVYASGFVGRMGDGAQVLDCFSTASCYSYSASYVGVVAVTLAWSGGLAGRIDKHADNVIARSHYAGDLSSRQYNPIAVIPIIQNDVNLGGIAGRASVGDATIIDCYFKPSVSLNGSSQGTASKKTIYALADDKTASGVGFGPWSDERYVQRVLWEANDYDFSGGTARLTANDAYVGAGHGNAWAMDYKLGIPVHGLSVKATLDFPGAGTAKIDATKLGIDQETSDPYTFAVSAILAGTAQGLAAGDTSVVFEQQTAAKPEGTGLSDANGGYRFMGWFRERNVMTTSIDDDNSWFDGKTDEAAVDAGKRVEENSRHDASSTYTADNAGGKDGFAGNDLFIAAYQAQVLFHDVTGNVLNAETGEEHADTSDDWYRYATSITPAIPQVKPESASATFIGWTTQPNTAAGSNGSYVGITSTDLTALKNAGAFVPVGQAVTVTAPADYYPVYSDYASNVITVFEGNEQDSLDDATQRDGVGKTHVKAETLGASTEYTVQVQDANGTALSDGGTLPDGYRFLGWYETKQVNGQDVDVRVSRDASYELPASVDLTAPHTYTARFEYRVDYYARSFHNGNGTDNFESALVYSLWQGYNTTFNDIKGVSYIREDVIHWGSEHVDHGTSSSKAESCDSMFTSSKHITAPLKAYSHNLRNDSGADPLYKVMFDTDFPGSGNVTEGYDLAASKFTFTPVSDRYQLRFWTLESEYRSEDNWTYVKNPMSTGTLGTVNTRIYKGRAMVTTDVNFYDKGGNTPKSTVTRRYESSLLMSQDTTYTYHYPFMRTTTEVSANPVDGSKGSVDSTLSMQASPSDSDMAVEGYKFLGWISTADVAKDSDVWNYIYDVSNDSLTTSDPAKAAPYLVATDAVVTQAQDVYPVYVKYNVSYDTNLHRAGFLGNDEVNAPNWRITPTITEADGVTTATVTPDITTTVYKDGTGGVYQLIKVELEKPDGTVRHLEAHGNDGNTYSATVEAGGAYTFVAYYEPLAVVYHLNATAIDGKVAQAGDALGKLKGGIPKPTFNVSDIDTAVGGDAFHQFVGWTTDKPTGDAKYVIWSASTDLVNANTVVNEPMELYPVYRATAVIVQSNIDSNLDNPSSVRGLSRTASGDQVSLEVKAVENVTGKDGTAYDFVCWSRDYKADDDTYTPMTGEATYALEGAEPFTRTVYTAVYKQSPLKVRYHDADGDVVYTATVEPGSERNTGAGFVHNMEVPKVDADGNPVYNEDGTQQVETKSVAYDADAYVDEQEELVARAASEYGVYKEMFLRWRSIAADGTTAEWDAFKDQPITGDMDLYPVTFYVTAHDTSNGATASASNNITAKMKWQLDPNASGTVAVGDDDARIKACFAEAFEGTQLTIHVEHVEYGVPGTGNDGVDDPIINADQMCVNNQAVSLYSVGDTADGVAGSFELEDKLATKVTGAEQQGDGNAVFDFPSAHVLTLVKQTADADAAGKTFRFTVTKAAAGSDAAQTRTVSVTVGASADAQGVYSGSVKLQVPAGTYTIEENTGWAWRYASSLSTPGGAFARSATVTVSAASSASDATVTCVNTKTNSQWIDGTSRAKNVWLNGAVSREGQNA